MPWSSFFEWWVLSQPFHSPLSLSSRDSSVLNFLYSQLLHPYMTTGKTVALTRWTFVGKVMSLLFNMLSRLVIAFLPSGKHLLISWLQSPSSVMLEHLPPTNIEILKILDSVYIKVQGEEGTVKGKKGSCHVWAPAVCQVLNITSSPPCTCLCRRCN